MLCASRTAPVVRFPWVPSTRSSHALRTFLQRPGGSSCSFSCRHVHIEARLAALGITELPPPPTPKGAYVFCTRSGAHAHVVAIPALPDSEGFVVGKVGDSLSTTQGQGAARLAAINMLSVLQAELGDLDRIVRMVKVTGYVQCVDGFDSLPVVLNGFSELLGEVLGPEKAVHARAAVGVNALPLNMCVEFEAMVEVD